MLIKHIIPVH